MRLALPRLLPRTRFSSVGKAFFCRGVLPSCPLSLSTYVRALSCLGVWLMFVCVFMCLFKRVVSYSARRTESSAAALFFFPSVDHDPSAYSFYPCVFVCKRAGVSCCVLRPRPLALFSIVASFSVLLLPFKVESLRERFFFFIFAPTTLSLAFFVESEKKARSFQPFCRSSYAAVALWDQVYTRVLGGRRRGLIARGVGGEF